MSISLLLPENNYNDIICNKILSETFNATSILNPNPTMEIYGSNSISNKQKVIPVGGQVSYFGNSLISDRINLINSCDVKFEIILTNENSSGLILVRFGAYDVKTRVIEYIFNGNPIYKFVPRGLDETVSVNFTLPFNNLNVPEITAGSSYTMFFTVYNFTNEQIMIRRPDSIPVKLKVFQY